MSDLTAKEQKAVRTALRFLRLRVGAWAPLAKALRYEWDSIQKVATGKKSVTPALALRVARFAGVGMDDPSRAGGCRPGSARTAATRRTTSWTKTRWSGDPRFSFHASRIAANCLVISAIYACARTSTILCALRRAIRGPGRSCALQDVEKLPILEI